MVEIASNKDQAQQENQQSDQELKCKRHGCLKKYKESENGPDACHFHTGNPLFHDTKKGWTCCQKIVYDWDAFQTIPTCAVGMHSNIDPMQDAKGQDGFFKSQTVQIAKDAEDKHTTKVQIKKISDYNKQVEQQQELKEQPVVEKKIFITPKGLNKCTNKGCMKEFDPTSNSEEACNYHAGEPVFHDLKKYWTCCKKETWDWDEFTKLPTCSKGSHVPKLV